MPERSDNVMGVISVGYKTFIMPVDDAVNIAKAMSTAEVYERKYRSVTDGGSTYHIYSQEEPAGAEVTFISGNMYRMGKLAGKPQA